MKTHMVTGGCGFVGRNMVKRLLGTTSDKVIVIDNLSTGTHPQSWVPLQITRSGESFCVFENRILFVEVDVLDCLRNLNKDPSHFQSAFLFDFQGKIEDVFHFAAVVGGRAKIDGDPMAVAMDLAIDAELFNWAVQYKPGRLLYPSSSAAYPISLQADKPVALKESDIQFSTIGQPDMTYGWSKLTGEFLAGIAAKHYGLKVTCIRPFSGYGEDQDDTYPIPAIAARAARREDPFEVWGSGNQGRDFVHIDDVIDCILIAMDEVHDGSAVNIGMGKLTTFREIIDIFCDLAGYKPTIKPLVDKPVGVLARYSDMSYVKTRLGWSANISIAEGMKRVFNTVESSIQRSNECLK